MTTEPIESPSTGTPRPVVSVVIPTHGRADLLERCLRSLLDQDFPREGYEVIVVEDRPSDGIVGRLLDTLRPTTSVPLRHELSQGIGPAAARNQGWRLAQADVIAFTDDDVIPHRRWLSEGLKRFRDGVVGVAGKTEVPLPPAPTDYQRNVGKLSKCHFLTCNVFYRKEGLEKVGGFDERFQRAYREDTDLHFTFEREGLRLTHADTAIVTHPPREAPAMVSIREQSKQMYDALLYKKHPALFRQIIRKQPPLNYYVITLCYVTAPIAAIAGNWILAESLGMVAGALVVEFLGRRLRGITRRPGHVLEMIATSFIIPPVAVYWRLRGAWHFRVPFF